MPMLLSLDFQFTSWLSVSIKVSFKFLLNLSPVLFWVGIPDYVYYPPGGSVEYSTFKCISVRLAVTLV